MDITCPSNLHFDLSDEPTKHHAEVLFHMKEYFSDVNSHHNLDSNISLSDFGYHSPSPQPLIIDLTLNDVTEKKEGEIVDLTIDENDKK